eukprot:gene44046-54734_t
MTTAGYNYNPVSIQFKTRASLDAAETTVVCSDQSSVSSIVKYLTAGSVGASAGSSSAVTCSEHSWVMKVCAASYPPALCVDCADPCLAAAHCASSTSYAPYNISPCVTSTCTDSSALRVLSVAYADFQAAPSLVSLDLVPQKTSITVNAVLSDVGTVYCGVFAIDSLGVSQTVSDQSQIKMQNFVSASSATTSRVQITGLGAATDYQMYCLTVSPLGSVTSLATIVSTSQSVSTLCCKTVTATLNTLSTRENAAVSNALTMTLSARPQFNLQVSIVALKLGSSGVITPATALYPVLFSVDSQSSTANF